MGLCGVPIQCEVNVIMCIYLDTLQLI
jgi:hypothetical protein